MDNSINGIVRPLQGDPRQVFLCRYTFTGVRFVEVHSTVWHTRYTVYETRFIVHLCSVQIYHNKVRTIRE